MVSLTESGRRGGGDRAQLLLIGAVVLAVTILGVVVVLNSTLYAQSVSSGNTVEDVEDMNQQQRTVEKDVERLVKQIVRSKGGVEEKTLDASLENYSKRIAELTAERKPVYVDAELNETASESEWQLVQNETRSLRSRGPGGEHDWTLAEDARGLSTFELVVDPQDAGGAGDQSFSVTIADESGDEWSLSSTQPSAASDQIEIEIENASGTVETYDTTRSARIDLLNGTINGTDRFEFAPDLEEPYTITFENGQHADGRYRIVLRGDVYEEHFNDPGDGSPYAVELLTTVAVDVRYESQELSATTPIEVDVEEVLAES